MVNINKNKEAILENELKRCTLEEIAKIWNLNNINYSIINGIQEYPKIGRDLDVMIDDSEKETALDLMLSYLNDNKWLCCVKCRKWVIWTFAYKYINKNLIVLEVDLVSCLQTGITRLVDGSVRSKNKFQIGAFWVDPWAAVVKRVILQFIGKNLDKFKKKPNDLIISESEYSAITKKLKKTYNISPDFYINALRSRQIEKIQSATIRLKRKLFLSSMKFNFSCFKNFIFLINRYIDLNIFPKRAAPIICLVGPDGVGKSTTIQELRKILEQKFVFPKIICRHWRPSLIPALCYFKSFIKGHKKGERLVEVLPRRKAGRFSIFRVIYYSLDFIFGGIYLDNRESARLNIILYDRHAIDMLVDPKRYGIKRMYKFIYKLIPKPDLTIALIDSTARIRERKTELTEEEIEEQIIGWNQLLKKGDIHNIIMVDSDPAEMAERVFQEVIKNFFGNNCLNDLDLY